MNAKVFCRGVFFSAMSLSVTVCSAPTPQPESRDMIELARHYVMAEANADRGLIPTPVGGRLVPSDISADETSLVEVAYASVYRMRLNVDHAHPYLTAVTESEVIRLGGFDLVELGLAAELFSLSPTSVSDLKEVARDLAVLADPYAAEEMVFPSSVADPVSDAVAVIWRTIKPLDWPVDSFETTETGLMARTTVLSHNVRSLTQPWVPIAYQFEFDEAGSLLAWSRLSGDGFQPAAFRTP